ncbi:MAG: DUF2971 domain-containing protein [Flavobacteriaceae bacterium]|nr:DUF2971 domain-containing protein [Flavobacteriaceae bacterium]
MALYKYYSFHNLKRALEGKVRFSQPGAFNDPFELLPVINMEGIADKQGNTQLQLSFDIKGKRRPVDPVEFKEEKSNYEHDLISRQIVDSLNHQIGIFCLSKNRESLLMWAHYADNYAGGIIEFDEEHSFFDGRIDVDYRKYRPSRSIEFYIKSKEPIPISELSVKSLEWKYEEESRVVKILSECDIKKGKTDSLGYPIYTSDIPFEAIKKIIVGERMPKEYQKRLFKMIKKTPVNFEIAVLDMAEYKMAVDPVKLDYPLHQIFSPRSAHLHFDS